MKQEIDIINFPRFRKIFKESGAKKYYRQSDKFQFWVLQSKECSAFGCIRNNKMDHSNGRQIRMEGLWWLLEKINKEIQKVEDNEKKTNINCAEIKNEAKNSICLRVKKKILETLKILIRKLATWERILLQLTLEKECHTGDRHPNFRVFHPAKPIK